MLLSDIFIYNEHQYISFFSLIYNLNIHKYEAWKKSNWWSRSIMALVLSRLLASKNIYKVDKTNCYTVE